MKNIYLYPLGGISKFYLPLNASYIKEFLILISGPIFQELAKIILILALPKESITINTIHYGILFFNFLPIYPLDGGKLTQLILSMFIPYKKSLTTSIIISYIFIIIYFILNIKLLKINNITMIIFLIYKVYKEHKKINYLYEKFILERYLNNYKYKTSSLIKNPQNFYKNKKHLIYIDDKYYLEEEYLLKKYKKSQ